MGTNEITPNDRFEAIGELYRRDTGYLRPGKSEPMGCGRDSNSEKNRARFGEWLETRAWSQLLNAYVTSQRELDRLWACVDELQCRLPESIKYEDDNIDALEAALKGRGP